MKTLAALMLSASLLFPYARAWADNDKKESATEEKAESREHQQAEEREAMEHYQKIVAKNGKDSTQAKKAWKRVIGEYKEHGDTPPSPDAVTAPASKS